MTCGVKAAAVVATFALAACAAKSAPPLPPKLAYPEFVYPVATPAAADQAAAVDRGWRFLQNDDLDRAEREFSAALERTPDFFSARTGLGYVALARKAYSAALTRFDRALDSAATYAPALAGKGQTLLLLGRDDEAAAALEAAVKADRSLEGLQPRIDVLRFRTLQNLITSAGAARTAGRLDEARAAYLQALEASPDSAVLHRELGVTERARGELTAALQSFRRALELDPSDASCFAQIGDILEGTGDYVAAEAAYRRAAALEPGTGFEGRADAVVALAREARLPDDFKAIAAQTSIRRGDLAALIGIRLESVLQTARRSAVVTTDTRGHWAAQWIADVVAADVMPAFDDHTFRPRAVLRRVDMAQAVNALLRLMVPAHPELQARMTARPGIADVTPAHLNYQAISAAVATGVLPLLEGARFSTERAVSGAEALAAMDRLRALDQRR